MIRKPRVCLITVFENKFLFSRIKKKKENMFDKKKNYFLFLRIKNMMF